MGYAVVLTIGAREVILEMGQAERSELIRCLRIELLTADGSPVADAEVAKHDAPAGVTYFAAPLTSAHVVIFRLMDDHELRELSDQRNEPKAPHGVFLFDILTGRSSFPEGTVFARRY